MKLPGEEESGRGGLPVFYMVVGVSVFMLLLLLVMLKSNNDQKSGSNYLKELQQQQQEESAAEEAEQLEEPERKLRAEDLDFWDMYPVEGEEDDEESSASTTSSASNKSVQSTFTEKAEKDRQEQQLKEQEQVLNDPSTDGKHTLVTNPDGTDEWVLISPYLNKSTYDFTKMEDKAGLKRYMENGKKISYVGTDISKQTGTVNFTSLKAAGVDYVMIRLGGRGYSSGQITLDENFKENIEGAIAEGLDVGIYFYSQAINQEEAIAEVNFIVQNLEPYRAHVKYPIAFDMEFVANDEARIDGLSREDRTTIATFFLDGVKAAGYVPMIYGDKEWLIKEVDLAKLQNYDVWLTQEEEVPDYPYQYAMWQYTTKGVLNGIKGEANLNICFIGYSQR